MPDARWADISYAQPCAVDDSYPLDTLCIRSNDGDVRDSKFDANRAWCESKAGSAALPFYFVYFVYRPSMNGFKTCRAMLGAPGSFTVIMIDVESWGGQISGDQSTNLNQEFNNAASFVGDARRVVGYGNVYDLRALWPNTPDGLQLVVADYSHTPSYQGMFAHQYTCTGQCHPFDRGGPPYNLDLNVAYGSTIEDLCNKFGFNYPGSRSLPSDAIDHSSPQGSPQ